MTNRREEMKAAVEKYLAEYGVPQPWLFEVHRTSAAVRFQLSGRARIFHFPKTPGDVKSLVFVRTKLHRFIIQERAR